MDSLYVCQNIGREEKRQGVCREDSSRLQAHLTFDATTPNTEAVEPHLAQKSKPQKRCAHNRTVQVST